MSSARFRVNVVRTTRACGSRRASIRARCRSTTVLPVPAPPESRNGPLQEPSTYRRCSGWRNTRHLAKSPPSMTCRSSSSSSIQANCICAAGVLRPSRICASSSRESSAATCWSSPSEARTSSMVLPAARSSRAIPCHSTASDASSMIASSDVAAIASGRQLRVDAEDLDQALDVGPGADRLQPRQLADGSASGAAAAAAASATGAGAGVGFGGQDHLGRAVHRVHLEPRPLGDRDRLVVGPDSREDVVRVVAGSLHLEQHGAIHVVDPTGADRGSTDPLIGSMCRPGWASLPCSL